MLLCTLRVCYIGGRHPREVIDLNAHPPHIVMLSPTQWLPASTPATFLPTPTPKRSHCDTSGAPPNSGTDSTTYASQSYRILARTAPNPQSTPATDEEK